MPGNLQLILPEEWPNSQPEFCWRLRTFYQMLGVLQPVFYPALVSENPFFSSFKDVCGRIPFSSRKAADQRIKYWIDAFWPASVETVHELSSWGNSRCSAGFVWALWKKRLQSHQDCVVRFMVTHNGEPLPQVLVTCWFSSKIPWSHLCRIQSWM